MNNGTSTVIWKQAIQFNDCGGWAQDCQFIEQMGFAYLLATGLGTPIDDAVTTVSVSSAGSYRLWVRCKDWYPADSPGRFQVAINDEIPPIDFGKAETSEWLWVDGGEFDLEAGETTIRLLDQTGWWSRCDAVVLSSDTNFRPSDDLSVLQEQRQEFGAILVPLEVKPYDVVVIGGGLAGVAAGVSAARHGARVALIQDRPVLGGNTSSEICVPALGDETREPWDPRETGIIEEFDPILTGKSGWSTNLEKVVEAEPNLDLFLNVKVTSVAVTAGSIESLDAMDTRSGQRYHLAGKLFIDCTGDGTVGFEANADYRHGKESRAEHNESLAPLVANNRTMGNTLFGGRIATMKDSKLFETPAWAYQWKSAADFEQRSTAGIWSNGELPVHFESEEKGNGRRPDSAIGPVGCWYAECGGMYDTIKDAEFIRDELFRICIGLWGYVKNHDPEFSKSNANKQLVELNHIAGKRESRRLLGDYILTQHDYADKIVHEDAIAYGGWTIDDHHPQGYFAPGPLAYHAYLQKMSIPYRCLYSRNVPNLLMAGRNVSATHIGFSGIRVMRTCCLMGQAAGTAAAIAIQQQTTPRGIYQNHLEQLQQALLKDGAYLLGSFNNDPSDLARNSEVSASSFVSGRDKSWLANPVSKWGTVHRMDTKRAVMFHASESRIDSISVFLRLRNATPTNVQLTLCQAEDFGDFNSRKKIATTEVVLPGETRGWVNFPLTAETKLGQLYYLEIPQTADLDWELYPYHAPRTLRGYDGPKWGALWGCYKFRLSPGGEPPASEFAASGKPYLFAPKNILDGRNRAVAGEPCSWAPDPDMAMPQYLELCFSERKTLNSIHVTFQLASLAASKYHLDAWIDESWQTIVSVEKNTLRRIVHCFADCTTDRIRLVLEAGQKHPVSPLIPVCELRIYNEPQQTKDGNLRK